ncbi:hypothetical protein [Parasitella parasitica]|uniref:Uncharacterized protein n=1 Tax=Parasitella parasitica TaxID=35722 RepID=A0A0B7NP80_9FUNG|nr:hypothetical protein [Parasitella parasitica]
MERSDNYNYIINEDISMIDSKIDLLDTQNDNNEIVTLMSMIRRGELSTHNSEEILEINMEYGDNFVRKTMMATSYTKETALRQFHANKNQNRKPIKFAASSAGINMKTAYRFRQIWNQSREFPQQKPRGPKPSDMPRTLYNLVG